VDPFFLDEGTVPVLRCRPLLAIPGISHGFSTRRGPDGVPFDQGPAEGSDASAARRRVFLRASGIAGEPLVLRQVHGAAVVRASEVRAGEIPEADAAVRGAAGRAPAVRTADCVPVLLADRAGTVVAAIHSGWRGTVLDIAGATVATLAADGIDPGQLVAAIGPCIEVGAFEVGEEVAGQFAAEFVRRDLGPKPHVDLVAVVRDQLARAGVPKDSIERVGGCTVSDPERYFSYRRDGAGIGQMLAFVGFRR